MRRIWLFTTCAALLACGLREPTNVRHHESVSPLETALSAPRRVAEDPPSPPDQLAGLTGRARYLARLHQHRLGDDPPVVAWRKAGRTALEHPVVVVTPWIERVRFGIEAEDALAYAVALQRGHRLRVSVRAPDDHAGAVFLDVHLVDLERPSLIFDSDGASTLTVDISHGGTYLVRVQPELHVDGALEITLEASASLAFPVAGRDSRSVQSRFGAPRDGGRRSHHGLDVFAPRGTHAVAVTRAEVVGVGSSRRGGNVVWLRDQERGIWVYYAHLERALVREGDRVDAGDPVGEIGNSGNARYTGPHLHFGLYHRGPIDPWPFVHAARRTAPPVKASAHALGRPVCIDRNGVKLRAAPGGREVVRELSRDTWVIPVAAHRTWWRVELADGTRGYLPPRVTDPANATGPDGSC